MISQITEEENKEDEDIIGIKSKIFKMVGQLKIRERGNEIRVWFTFHLW